MDEESLREWTQRNELSSQRNDWCELWHSSSPTVFTMGNLLLICAEVWTSGCINTITGSLDPSDTANAKQLAEQSPLCSAELLAQPVNPCYWHGHPQTQSQIFRFATFCVVTPRLWRLCYWSAQSVLQRYSARLLMRLFRCIRGKRFTIFLQFSRYLILRVGQIWNISFESIVMQNAGRVQDCSEPPATAKCTSIKTKRKLE